MYRTTDLCDEHSQELQVAEDVFQSFGKHTFFHGPIHTVDVWEDNVLVVKALETISSGSVLVVNGGGSRRCALLGDRLAGIAVERKLAGIIINGCVRDTAELAQMEVGILALGKSPLKSDKEGKGTTDQAITFAGVTWKPGNYVYADEDGIVVSSRAL